MARWILSCFYSKVILKISQAKGLRDPRYGCIFEPSALLRRLGNMETRVQAGSARGDQGRVAVPLPLQPWA